MGWLTALIFAMVIATGMTATVGASFFITNWQAQRQISGRPREWFSAEQLYRRRQGLAHLLAPALLAYIATVAAGFGTSALTADWPGWMGIAGAQGSWLIFGGGIALVAGVLAVVGRVPRNSWDLVQSHEALLYSMRHVDAPVTEATIAQWRDRFSEIAAEPKSPKGPRAAALWAIDHAWITLSPKPLAGRLVGPGSTVIAGPTWRAVSAWTRGRPSIIAIWVVGSLSALFWAMIGIFTAPSYGASNLAFSAGLCLVSLAGLCLSMLGARLELVWYSRAQAMDLLFQAQIQTEIQGHERALARERDEQEVVRSMRAELTQVKEILHRATCEIEKLVDRNVPSTTRERSLVHCLRSALASRRAPLQ